MKKVYLGAVLSLGILLAPSIPARAQFPGGAGYVTPADELETAESRLQKSKIQLDHATENFARRKALYEAGQTTAADINNATAERLSAENDFAAAQWNLGRMRRVARLTQPINVDLKDATVVQAAEALYQVSNVPIRVDKGVVTDKRLSASATGVPMASVLESIARQMNLQIAPDQNWGVVLRSWPMLKINGVERQFTDPGTPWAESWSPFSGSGSSSDAWKQSLSRWPNQTDKSNAAWKQAVRGWVNQANKTKKSGSVGGWISGKSTTTTPYATWTNTNTPLTMTSVRNQVVIAEPGRGPRGESGIWLTVFALRGTELVQQSSLFHKAHSAK